MANLLNQDVVDYPDTTTNNLVSRTPPRVTPLLPKSKVIFSSQQTWPRLRWWVHRAKLQRSHFARMKQRALPFLVVPKMCRYQYCIQMLHKYLFGCFGLYFGCQLSVLSYVHVKPDSPSEIRIKASTPKIRILSNSDKILTPDPSELTKYYCTSRLLNPNDQKQSNEDARPPSKSAYSRRCCAMAF